MDAYRDGTAIIAPRRAEGPDVLGDAWMRLEPGSDEYQMWDDWLRATETVQAAAGVDTHLGGEELKHYWVHGKGAAKWSTWTELYHHLLKYLNMEMAKRTAAEWFHLRYGFWPGADLNRVKHGKPPRGHVVGPG